MSGAARARQPAAVRRGDLIQRKARSVRECLDRIDSLLGARIGTCAAGRDAGEHEGRIPVFVTRC